MSETGKLRDLRVLRGETLIDEKRANFLKHFVEFLGSHFSNRVKDDVLFDTEKPLRANEARVGEFATFEIAAGQRNRESIGTRSAGDLAQNQILPWKIGNH